MLKSFPLAIAVSLFSFALVSCSQDKPQDTLNTAAYSDTDTASTSEDTLNPMNYKGVGPITSVELGTLDPALAEQGKRHFETTCMACHRFESKAIGPPLKGVTTRRTPEWIMNMILNPIEMGKTDPIAQQLLAEYKTQMTPVNLSKEEARAVLEYLRSVDAGE